MTHYDVPEYHQSGAVRNVDQWHNGRIDFSPYPYPSATKLLVEAMRITVGGSDSTFLAQLTNDFVAADLVDYRYVTAALENNPAWLNDPSVDATSPYEREEIIKL